MAGGRCDPGADIGLVFLFFYGLERRLFHEREVAEAPILTREVERLLAIHGSNASFRYYAGNFLAAATLLTGHGSTDVEPSPPQGYQDELPIATRLHLGRLLADGRPLGSRDAMLWVLGSPEARLRTPGQRCFDELVELFAVRFDERHPKGLRITAPKRRISMIYNAANRAFSVPIPGPHEDLPDISAVSAPLAGLRDMLDAVQVELDAYSRLLGRKPTARGTVEAALLLPTPLRDAAVQHAAASARSALLAMVGEGGFGVSSPGTILAALGIKTGAEVDRLPPGIVNQMQQQLDALGFGMEPDRRHGGGPIGMSSEVVLFDATGGAKVDPGRPAYVRARAALEVAALAAAADGDVSDVEFASLVRSARAMPGLDPAEAVRVEAFAWTLRSRARGGNALRRAAGLPIEARETMARAALAVVMADGHASPAEVAFLERLHRSLDLPVERMHATLHQGAGGVPLPSTAPAMLRRDGQSPIALDAVRLARLRQETAEVATLLSGIFVEQPATEPAKTPPAPPRAAACASRFEGLDDPHGALLAAVVAVGRVTATQFDATAREFRLLPEGAVETINDWAFDRHGEAVLEIEQDEVIVVPHLHADLLAAAGAA